MYVILVEEYVDCLNSLSIQHVFMSYAADMRIVLLGSGGAILNLYWFLSYRDTRLVTQASKIVGKDHLLAFCKHWLLVSLIIDVIPENEVIIAP